ncbi:Uncharacterised protein [Legionella londiniensis]|nr:Uncharacterised protein [Legionella londiniensis]
MKKLLTSTFGLSAESSDFESNAGSREQVAGRGTRSQVDLI